MNSDMQMIFKKILKFLKFEDCKYKNQSSNLQIKDGLVWFFFVTHVHIKKYKHGSETVLNNLFRWDAKSNKWWCENMLKGKTFGLAYSFFKVQCNPAN